MNPESHEIDDGAAVPHHEGPVATHDDAPMHDHAAHDHGAVHDHAVPDGAAVHDHFVGHGDALPAHDGGELPIDEATLHARLTHITAHLERLNAARATLHEPAWLRRTTEEPRLPVVIAVLALIGLQAVVPHNLTFRPWWLLPTLELLLLVVLLFFRQTQIDRRAKILRVLGLMLVAAAGLATAWSAFRLVDELIHPVGSALSVVNEAGPLLRSGGAIWLTNVLVFSLLYWEMDRGGPAERACGTKHHADFMFAQMTAPELAPKDWEPAFVDYLYLSFTNATAFSPTDTLPLTRWAKMTMLVQSAISLLTVGLVIARAVNVFKGTG